MLAKCGASAELHLLYPTAFDECPHFLDSRLGDGVAKIITTRNEHGGTFFPLPSAPCGRNNLRSRRLRRLHRRHGNLRCTHGAFHQWDARSQNDIHFLSQQHLSHRLARKNTTLVQTGSTPTTKCNWEAPLLVPANQLPRHVATRHHPPEMDTITTHHAQPNIGCQRTYTARWLSPVTSSVCCSSLLFLPVSLQKKVRRQVLVLACDLGVPLLDMELFHLHMSFSE